MSVYSFKHQQRNEDIEMNTRIEYCQNGTKLCWFVDAWINGGWKNISSHKTKDEAIEQVARLSRG